MGANRDSACWGISKEVAPWTRRSGGTHPWICVGVGEVRGCGQGKTCRRGGGRGGMRGKGRNAVFLMLHIASGALLTPRLLATLLRYMMPAEMAMHKQECCSELSVCVYTDAKRVCELLNTGCEPVVNEF